MSGFSVKRSSSEDLKVKKNSNLSLHSSDLCIRESKSTPCFIITPITYLNKNNSAKEKKIAKKKIFTSTSLNSKPIDNTLTRSKSDNPIIQITTTSNETGNNTSQESMLSTKNIPKFTITDEQTHTLKTFKKRKSISPKDQSTPVISDSAVEKSIQNYDDVVNHFKKVEEVMVNNIQKFYDRNKLLDNLQEKADTLSRESSFLHLTTKNVQKSIVRKNYRFYVILIGIVAVSLCVTVSYACAFLYRDNMNYVKKESDHNRVG